MGAEVLVSPNEDAPRFSLRYTVKRSEIWLWYWSAWARWDGLWRYWLVVAAPVAAGTLLIARSDHSLGSVDFAHAVGAVSIAFLFFVVFPQLAYRPRERKLAISSTGIDTSIGSLSGHRGWRDIASIEDHGDFIALVVAGGIPLGIGWIRTQNGNAFVIPTRAFASAAQRQALLHQAVGWHSAQAAHFPCFAWKRYFE